MKIYQLLIEKSEYNSALAMVSSYVTPKSTIKQVFYANKELAEKQEKEILAVVAILHGPNNPYTISITEIDVKEE